MRSSSARSLDSHLTASFIRRRRFTPISHLLLFPFYFCSATQKCNSAAHTVAAGGLACAAYLLRTAGIVLLVAWIIESLIRRRWKQAAIRAAVAAVPILAWQCYIWQVTRSEEYHHPVYPYQRAAYYYSNVTYGENSSLKDPFQPELGRSKTSDLFSRIARNAVAIPVGTGRELLDRTSAAAISTAQAFSYNSGLATSCPPCSRHLSFCGWFGCARGRRSHCQAGRVVPLALLRPDARDRHIDSVAEPVLALPQPHRTANSYLSHSRPSDGKGCSWPSLYKASRGDQRADRRIAESRCCLCKRGSHSCFFVICCR